MLALIDGDIVAYRCAASAEKETEAFIALSRTNSLFEEILKAVGATEWKTFITGSGNFRREIYPAYKANRKQAPPKWLETCERYLIDEWGASVTDGCEADDMLGVEITKNPEAIIASIDKDMLQIPGTHYNFVRKETIVVSKARGIRDFYISMLVGDRTDNIPGVKSIGKAKAPRVLDGCETEQEMFDAVRECYNDDDNMVLNGKLLWIWRTLNGTWEPTRLFNPAKNTKQDREQLRESIVQTQVVDTLCMVRGGTI